MKLHPGFTIPLAFCVFSGVATGGGPPLQPQGPPPVSLPGEQREEYERCNSPSFSLDASLRNDNRRTTGLVLAEGGYLPPVQQTRVSASLENIWCWDTDLEASAWYSLHEASTFEETHFTGRMIVEVLPRVRVYGGFAHYDNPDGLFREDSLYLIAGSEYPSVWETTFSVDYLRDVRENGDWLTLMFMKSHRLGTKRGAVFTYKQGLGATFTRKLPTNVNTPSMTGVPSTFYRAILEVDDGPVTWYFEASPHVSFVSRATGVRKKHLLLAAGLIFELP